MSNNTVNIGKGMEMGRRLIYRAYKSMPITNQKILIYLISLINPQTKSITVEFNTKQFTKALGIKLTSTSFSKIITTLENTINKSFFLKQANDNYVLWHWWSNVVTKPVSSDNDCDMTFVITFNKMLKTYLLRDASLYEHVSFQNIYLMKNQYSPLLFALFLANYYKYHKSVNYSLDFLHKYLNLIRYSSGIYSKESSNNKYVYADYSDFRKRVLLPVSKEINNDTAYRIKVNPLSTNNHHKITSVEINLKK